ncbi:MAG: hypothetical protein HY958_04520 [Bacteroidia bacterium]|nr:hypothetical protein [Bacteroidia bacterium]
MKKICLLFVLSGILLTAYFNSCKKDDFDFRKISGTMDWNPSFVFPVAYGSLSMRDILRDYDTTNLFHWESTGLLYVMYNSMIGQFSAYDKFYMENQYISESVSSADLSLTGFDHAGATVQFTKTENKTITFFPADAQIDSALIKSSTLVMNITSTFHHPGSVTIIFPSITKNGIPYSWTEPITTSSGTFSVSGSHDGQMEGYKMDLTTTGSHSILPVQFNLELTHSGDPSTAGAITFDVKLNNMKYKNMFGFFGTQKVIFQGDSLDLKMFSEAFAGGFYFVNPQMTIRIKNSFGIPCKFFFNDLKSISTLNNNQIVDFHNTPPYSPIPFESNKKDINYPNLLSGQYGQTAKDSIQFDGTNTNFAEVVGTSPHWVRFHAEADVNTAPVTYTNFITEDSYMSADVEVVLPLWGWANGLALGDTSKFEFSPYYHDYHGNILQRALLRVTSDNGFPVDIGLQVYFAKYDSLTHIYTIKDSLMTNTTIVPAGDVNSVGRVVTPGTKTADILIEQQKLKKMYYDKTTHIFLRGYFNTKDAANHTSVKFYNDYKLKIRLGMQCDFGTNTNTLQNY